MTIEEIKEAVKGEPTLLDGLTTYIIGTDKGKQILTDHAQVEFDKKIHTRVGEIYSQIDADMKEITGIDKPSDVKTYAHIKQHMNELVKLRKGGSGDDVLKTKIKELETKLKDDNGKHWHELYQGGLAKWNEEKGRLENELSGVKTDMERSLIVSAIQNGRNGIKLSDTIPSDAQTVIMQNAINDISNNAQLVDGNVVLRKIEDGKLVTWTNEHFKPISTGDALKEVLGNMIHSDANTGGNANQGAAFGKVVSIGDGKEAKKHIRLDKSKVKTQEDFADAFHDATVNAGIGYHTKEWFILEQETMKQMGVTELPFSNN